MFASLDLDERLSLLIEAHHAGEPLDPLLIQTIPADEQGVWNASVRAYNGINEAAGSFLGIVDDLLDRADLLQLRWITEKRCLLEAEGALAQLVWSSPEPIIASKYGSRVQEARDEWVPVSELADRLPEVGAAGIQAAISAGRLETKRQNRQVCVRAGAFDDWQGLASSAVPEWGLGFDVRPDQEATTVAELRARREQSRVYWRRRYGVSRDAAAQAETAMVEYLGARWMELRLVEIGNEELSDRFGGRCPVHPDYLAELASTKNRLLQLCRDVGEDMQVPLADPPDELLAEFLALLNRRS